MTEDPDHRRTMQASGTAPFVGHAADRPRAERARSLETPDRHGPLKTGRFVVEIGGTEVAGFRTVDLPARSTGLVESREGTDGDQQRQLSGRTEYEDLEMERGMRKGDSTLDDWRTAVDQGKMEEAGKEVVVSVQDETGTSVLTWRFTNARPLAYDPPTLDATASGGGGIAAESVTVDFEGVERIADSGPVQQQQGREDSGVFRYVRTANGGRIENGAVVTTASDVGIDSVTLDWLDASATADAQHVGLLVPEGARSGGSASALWLLRGSDFDEGAGRTVSSGAAGRLYWVPGGAFFHDRAWRAGSGESESSGAESSPEWSVPGWPTGDPSSVQVLVDTGGQSLEDAFGMAAGGAAAQSAGVQSAAAGDTVDPASTVFAVVGPATAPFESPSLQVSGSGPGQVADLLDAGRPAPLAGATFGLATFSTPDASIAGQSVNPLVGMETTALLEHETARQVLGQAGITDIETVEWLDGPRSTGTDASTSVQMLGTGTTVESYEGVVSGQNGPWAVVVHVARITDDSHVIAAGAHRQPLGTESGLSGAGSWQRVVTRGRRFTAETASRLEYL
jgi:phage tail-like protein